MEIARLRRDPGFWKRLSFVGNICKVRSALLDYLQGEGIKCTVSEGMIHFEFDETTYQTSLAVGEGYGECTLVFCCGGEEYEALSDSDKTFVADKINSEMYNHVTVVAFNDTICATTSFYFTNRHMLVNLFSVHFEELTQTADATLDLVCSKLEVHEQLQERKIGFHFGGSKRQEPDNGDGKITSKA